MKWKDEFKNLTFITGKYEQEYYGDYSGYCYSDFWESEVLVYIEEKELLHSKEDSLFIETWSCREGKNIGWIYKQLDTEYLVYSNRFNTYLIDYAKLRKKWFKIYPNPIKVNDGKLKGLLIENNGYRFAWNKVPDYDGFNKNRSEGYYIPIEWFYDNNLIIKSWGKSWENNGSD